MAAAAALAAAAAVVADDSSPFIESAAGEETIAVPIEISRQAHGAYEASIAADGDDLAVAWYDTRGGYPQIFVRFPERQGAAGEELQLTRGKRYSYEPSLQMTGDQILVAWSDRRAGSERWTARLASWSKLGTQNWQVRLSASHASGRNPVLRVFDGKLFCAWLEGKPGQAPSVWIAWVGLDGRSLVGPRRVAQASRDTWNLNADIDAEGRAWVVFDARVGTRRSELFLIRADEKASRVDRLSSDDGVHSVYPDIALEGANAALTWFDERDGNTEVYLFAADRDTFTQALTSQTLEIAARRVTQTRGHSIGAYLTWNGATGGLAWCDDTDGQFEVFFQPFDRDGAAISPARQLSHSLPGSLIPAITPWRGGFALAWNEYQPAVNTRPKSASRSAVVMTTIP